MKKIKFVVGPNKDRVEDYARENKLGLKEYVYLREDYQLRGIDAKTIEFVYLDGWWGNSYYERKDFDDLVRMYVILGAKKTYA